MSDETYSKDELQRDLYLMVKAGLLEINMREDGQWLYSASEASKNMTEEEREDILSRLEEFDTED
jgi:hypothetical protein